MAIINLAKLEENKVSLDLNSYPVVFMGKTGDGKTDSLNRHLRAVAPEGKVPLFLMFEDRHKAIPNIMAQRIYGISDIKSVLAQLKNPKVREKFSCIVIDTADKFEEMVNKYISDNKEVEIIEDIGFSRGKKYLKAQLSVVSEIRNLGLPVHWAIQSYEVTDFKTQQVIQKCKLSEEMKAQIFHEAFLVGLVKPDPKAKGDIHSDRLITFRKTSENIELKDTLGLPNEMYVMDIKPNLEKLFATNYSSEQLTSDVSIIDEVVEVSFDEVKNRGQEIGSILVDNGLMDETLNILAKNIGVDKDGNAQMFDSLIPSQLDLAKVVVQLLEELAERNNIKV